MEPLARWVGVAFAVMLLGTGCYRPGNGSGDASSDTSDSEEVSDGAEMSDGTWEPGDLTLEAGRLVGDADSFEAYADDGSAVIELVMGFQGGYHIEPALRLQGVETSGLETEIEYVVTRTSNGNRLNRPSEFRIGRRGWEERETGYIHRSNPVIFDIQRPSDIVGDEVELQLRVDVDSGGRGTTRVVGTIVDEEGR